MQTSTCTRTIRSLRLRSAYWGPISSLNTPRLFSATRLLRNDDAGGEDGAFKKGKRAKVDPQAVESWFNGEGLPYRNPTPGKPNWLGGETPYPDNPTFRPPPPLSDIVKSSIYDRYLNAVQSLVSNPEAHVQAVRKLSEQFGISNSRIEAIIRLKQYEKRYQKASANYNVYRCLLITQGKRLQYAFQKGMESYLGIRLERERAVVSDSKVDSADVNAARQRSAEVDNEVSGAAKEDQKSGAARRVWWEMVEDAPNSRPIVPGLIAKDVEAHRKRISDDQQAHAGVPLHIDGPVPSPGKARGVFTFIDTGIKSSTKKARA